MSNRLKQPALKPQDLVVALKIHLVRGPSLSFARLGQALHLSTSEAHAAAQRALLSRLLLQADGALYANEASLLEFMFHGLRYVFPLVEGTLTRGMPTGVHAEPLRSQFNLTDALPQVWAHDEGEARGPAVLPLYPGAPAACRADPALYAALALADALRGGAAREREMAQQEMMRLLR